MSTMSSPTEFPVTDNNTIPGDGPVVNSSSMPLRKRKREEDDSDDSPDAEAPKYHKPESRRRTRRQTTSVSTPSSESNSVSATAASPAASPAINCSLSDAVRDAISKFHENKPEPSAEPPVWSEKRAALNDALPYFKSHQGSLHTIDKMPQGMLIDAEVGTRDHFGSQVIITSVGGGRVHDETTRRMTRTQDQVEDNPAYKALKRAQDEKQPIAVVAGAKNRIFPVKPAHYYNVLGIFHITYLWTEMTEGPNNNLVKFYMVRLEKVNLGERSWWTPSQSTGHDAGEFRVGEYSCPTHECEECGEESKKIFKQGWTCLTRDCRQFFQFAADVDFDELEYNEQFLKERTSHDGPRFKHNLLPALPRVEDMVFGSEKECKLGIVCPKCHCCSRRIKWSHWYCENDGCDFTYAIPFRMIPKEKITQENHTVMSRRKAYRQAHDTIRTYKRVVGDYRLNIHFLPDGKGGYIGSVTRIRPSRDARKRPGGINDLYVSMQESDIPLERLGARNAGGRIEELTSHFVVNYGAPYKYGVFVRTSTPFEDAPHPILETQKRLTWAGKTAVKVTNEILEEHRFWVPDGAIPEDLDEYNEQLVLGYFEKSRISPHDDGEKELGPNVATLSLGSPSIMKFYPKKGSGIGNGKSPMLSMILKHGDMLVMHGEQIQKRYLHGVEPHGMHRFAMTCRYIRPETISDEEQRNLAVHNAELPDDWVDIRYNGERDQHESCSTGKQVSLPGTD
ncbi:hypothetical protein F5Y06DRAFT_303962 [Hypoxylon sp. FL0890]|nr:hypothetical protein F5Y06DRAFT_303962 [Hypoxylon sp. FL0890]